MSRPLIKNRTLRKALTRIWKATVLRRKAKKTPEIASTHELLGMLIEEMGGLQQSITSNQPKTQKLQQLENLGVMILCAIATLESNAEDW